MNDFNDERGREFERVVAEQLDSLYRAALRLLGNASDAEDAVQECCARACNGLRKLKSDDAIKPWLFRILRNVCIDRLRWQSRVRLVSTDEADFAAGPDDCRAVNTPEQLCIGAALGRLVDEGMRGLPFEQRAVVIFVLVEGFTYAEAAEALQVPVGTVRSRLSRARAHLRQVISSRDKAVERAGTPRLSHLLG